MDGKTRQPLALRVRELPALAGEISALARKGQEVKHKSAGDSRVVVAGEHEHAVLAN